MSSKFIGKKYSVDPKSIKFDFKLIDFNKKKKDSDYESLKRSILKDGQTDPIYIKNGLCGNGKHRVQVCIDIGIDVIAVDIDPSIGDKTYLELCNKDTFTGRNDSATQLAIKAYKMTKEYGYEDIEAMKTLGITNKSVIGYIRYIDNSRFSDIIDILANGERANINGLYTKSIDVAKRKIAKILELEQEECVKIDTENEVLINYNEYINTHSGIDWFWEQYKMYELRSRYKMNYETAMLIIELANYKFKKVV